MSVHRLWHTHSLKAMKHLTLALLVLIFSAVVAFAADIDGTWNMRYQTPNDIVEATVILKAKGSALFLVTDEGEHEVGSVSGSEFSYTVPDYYAEAAGYRADLTIKGKVNGDTTEGTWEWDTYGGVFTGARAK